MGRDFSELYQQDGTFQQPPEETILILGCPREEFSAQEFEMLRKFVREGGSLLVLLSAGGEARNATNINFLLEEYGMSVNADSVVRASFHKYMHPKECHITGGVVNRAVAESTQPQEDGGPEGPGGGGGRASGFDVVYPNGATVSVQDPAVVLMTTGSVAHPPHRAILAAFPKPGAQGFEGVRGKIAVLGSADMLSDAWIDKEENSRVLDFLFKWMRPGSSVELNAEDAENAETSEHSLVPDIIKLADRLKAPLVSLGPPPRARPPGPPPPPPPGP